MSTPKLDPEWPQQPTEPLDVLLDRLEGDPRMTNWTEAAAAGIAAMKPGDPIRIVESCGSVYDLVVGSMPELLEDGTISFTASDGWLPPPLGAVYLDQELADAVNAVEAPEHRAARHQADLEEETK